MGGARGSAGGRGGEGGSAAPWGARRAESLRKILQKSQICKALLRSALLRSAKCKNLKNLLMISNPPPPGGRAHSAGHPQSLQAHLPRRKRNIAPFAYTYVKNRPGSVPGFVFFRSKNLNFCSRSLLISLFAISPFSATAATPSKIRASSRPPPFRHPSNPPSTFSFRTHTGRRSSKTKITKNQKNTSKRGSGNGRKMWSGA